MISLLSLDVSKTFNRVSHTRLAHNLRKRRILIYLLDWVKDFLKNRRTTIRLDNFILPEAVMNIRIPQGSPVSPILYLFFNADLLKKREDIRFYTSATGFVDNINILIFSESIERNYRTLKKIHDRYKVWMRKHDY